MELETKKEENRDNDNIKNGGLLSSSRLRIAGIGSIVGVLSGLLVLINTNFGDVIRKAQDNAKERAILTATIEQLSNEIKRTNQLQEIESTKDKAFKEQQTIFIKNLQQTVEFQSADIQRARQLASEEREEQNKKLDQLLSENKRVKKDLELSNSNTNQISVDLKKCKEDCKLKR